MRLVDRGSNKILRQKSNQLPLTVKISVRLKVTLGEPLKKNSMHGTHLLCTMKFLMLSQWSAFRYL